MSPSGCLCLLTIIGLLLPTRESVIIPTSQMRQMRLREGTPPAPGQTLKETTSLPSADTITVNIHALTQTPDTVHPESQSTPQTSLQAGGTTQEQTEETHTPRPTRMDVLPATDPRTGQSGPEATPSAAPTKGTTLSKRRSPGKDVRPDAALGPTGASEDNPFSYDEDTLRKRGLLVAAVLFITGIVILTSGKCRRLPQLCRNYNR
ncbi:FXYD domain-containing ion transport regulator 5 isoform X4 [Herpailurus yagouaroundi]|nr:FXYD domain-containing ion transport regulator 5 isoform X4 [Puma yagouaroundi]XP_040302091.1 FXYD domain-containing ion transport regulator 5 isoform X4 [Puma yagouaroundi]XP_040302092.1 FXYD domain-containing ion transport regulator 5 isoform X4 [Puma yagouaroundi]